MQRIMLSWRFLDFAAFSFKKFGKYKYNKKPSGLYKFSLTQPYTETLWPIFTVFFFFSRKRKR